MAADPGGQLCRFGLVDVQVGDGVDGFGGEAAWLVETTPATADLQGLDGVREVDPGGDGEDLQRANLAAAVAAVIVAGGLRDLRPGQAGELCVQVGLVALHGQNPVGVACGEICGVFALAVHRVGGDHRVSQVTDLVEQRREPGDLIGLAVDIGAGKDDAGVLIAGGQDVPGCTAGGA